MQQQGIAKFKQYSDAIINGVRAGDFPPLPADYGYRDSTSFWFHRKKRMRAELLPMCKSSLESVRCAADRICRSSTTSAPGRRTKSDSFPTKIPPAATPQTGSDFLFRCPVTCPVHLGAQGCEVSVEGDQLLQPGDDLIGQ